MNGIIKNRMTYVLICLTVTGLIAWIIAGISGDDTESDIMVDQETYTMETQSDVNQEDMEPDIVTDPGYYIVRADDEQVCVYWVDNSGEHLHKETTIPFALLSTEDQKILENGVRFDSDEKLEGFLESYDS